MKRIAIVSTVAALTLAACVSTGTAAGQGMDAAIQDIPWPQVGGGWTLATWNPATPTRGGEAPVGPPAADTLYLVSPDGVRYKITTFAPPTDDLGSPTLVDWSGDGGRALFYDRRADDSTDVIQVDLHTGAQTTFNVAHFDVTPRYTRPEGKAVLLVKSNDSDSPRSLTRVDLAGNHQFTYPIAQFGSKQDPDVLSTPDGTRLVVGNESGGLAMMGNDGKDIVMLPVAGEGFCSPTRWWDADAKIVVADCHNAEFSQSQLWLVPVDGSEPNPLTAVPDSAEDDEYMGAGSAWKLPEGIFVQAYGPCGYRYLAKSAVPGRLPVKVAVPKVDQHSSVDIIGAYHGKLQLRASLACGSGQSLLSYDPGGATSTVLLGSPVNGGGVVAALPFPGDE